MSGQGFTTKVAVKKQTTFGTAVSVSSLLPFTSEALRKKIELVESEMLDGTYGKKQLYQGFESAGGDLGGEAVFDIVTTDPYGWEHLIEAALGSANYNTNLSANVFTTAASLPLLTVAALKYFGSTGKVIELRSAKVNTLEVSGAVGTAGGKVSWTASLVGEKLLRTGESGIVNTTSTFGAITPEAKPQPLLMSKLKLYLGDQDDALDISDTFGVEEFTLTINNNLSDDTFSSYVDGDHENATLPLEHERDGRMEVTLRLVRPRLSDTLLVDWYRQGTSLQAKLRFDSVTGSKYHEIYLPYLKITEDPAADVDGPGLLKEEVTLTAVYNTDYLNDTMLIDSSAIFGPIAWVAKSYRTAVPE